MSITESSRRLVPERTARSRSVLMCRPDHFTVAYRINPWMDPRKPTDTARALEQWESLVRLYESLGHQIELIDPIPGLPDMVYAANGGFTVGGTAFGASFAYPERRAEGPAYLEWFRSHGFDTVAPAHINEGEGDFLLAGESILAGTGFRSASRSHRELGRLFDREVLSLTLVDPSFYHLDTALAVLDDRPGHEHLAYLPGAFDEASLGMLRERFPDAIEVDAADAEVLGLNSFSDGLNVVIATRATGYERQLREHGYRPVGVDLSELLLGGGGVKCCTLELRR